MIIPDTNMLVYAYHTVSPFHEPARRWWEGLINGTEHIGLPWVVTTGFVRIMTRPGAMVPPATLGFAVDHVQGWFRFPHVAPVNPGPEHLTLFRRNLLAAGVGGNLATDSHIAALAMEYGAEVHTNDRDFSRFPGLRWLNPLL